MTLPEGVGRQRHQVDGHWERSRTIFDSELYRALLEVIEDALGHADDPIRRAAVKPIDFDKATADARLSPVQAGVIEAVLQNKSLGEIAKERGVSKGTVQTQLLRARVKYQAALDAQ